MRPGQRRVGWLWKGAVEQALRVGPLDLPGFRDVRHPPPIWIAVKCPSGSRLILQDSSMKAMTWLKVGGGALVTLAGFAAAGTHYAEVTGLAPVNPESHAIASEPTGCPVKKELAKSGCCKKETKAEPKQGGCCRK